MSDLTVDPIQKNYIRKQTKRKERRQSDSSESSGASEQSEKKIYGLVRQKAINEKYKSQIPTA